MIEQCFVLLGGTPLPAASQEAGASSRQKHATRALLLLCEALQIIDSLGDRPELGAKLNEVIESLQEERGDE